MFFSVQNQNGDLWVTRVPIELEHCCTIFLWDLYVKLYYHWRNPNHNERDHLDVPLLNYHWAVLRIYLIWLLNFANFCRFCWMAWSVQFILRDLAICKWNSLQNSKNLLNVGNIYQSVGVRDNQRERQHKRFERSGSLPVGLAYQASWVASWDFGSYWCRVPTSQVPQLWVKEPD